MEKISLEDIEKHVRDIWKSNINKVRGKSINENILEVVENDTQFYGRFKSNGMVLMTGYFGNDNRVDELTENANKLVQIGEC